VERTGRLDHSEEGGLPGRTRRLIARGALGHEEAFSGLFRFVLVGLAVTALYLVLVLALDAAGIGARLASVLALAATWAASYLAQGRITFRAEDLGARPLLRFAAMSILGLGIAQGFTIGLYEMLGLPLWVAALAICIAIPASNFLLMNFWVFRARR